MTNFRNAMMAAAYTASASGVTIENSALFSAINQSLSRSQGSGSNTVWTFSSWIYKCESKNQVFCNFGSSPEGQLGWNASDQFYIYNGSTTVGITTQVFRDIGWYHIHLAYNTGESGTDKVKLSVNGSLVTAWATDNRSSAGAFNNANQSGQTLRLGNNGSDSGTICLSGYMSQICIIDGSAVAASSFINVSDDGNFVTPKSDTDIKALADAGASANSFLLDMSSNPQTDFSTHGNNFTNNNTVTTSTHTPTNLNALFNPLNFLDITTRFPVMTVGNTTTGFSTSGSSATGGLTFPVTYNTHIEFIFSVAPASGFDHQYPTFKVFPFNGPYDTALVQQPSGNFANDAGLAAGATRPNFANGDRITMEIDASNGRIYLWQNGSALNSANPGSNSGFTFDYTPPASGAVILAFTNGNSTSKALVNSNPADFEDTVSTGYFPLTSTEIAKAVTLPESTIDDHFRTILYTGNGSTQTITTTIRPDFIWTKNRTSSGPAIVDAVRGATKIGQTNSSGAEQTSSDSITSLGSSSYDLGADTGNGGFNDNTDAHVAWVAELGGVPSATNSAGAGATPTAGSVKIDGVNLGSALAGSIAVTKLTASTELGMSVGTYSGSGGAGTIATGLTNIEFIIIKRTNTSSNWASWHSGLPDDNNLYLDVTNAKSADGFFDTSSNTSSTFALAGGGGAVNASGSTYVFYAFAPSNFISIGNYKSNANVNGPFAPTSNLIPMRPKWVMIKDADGASQWWMWDDQRSPNNLCTKVLYANLSNAEDDSVNISLDMVSGGFKLRTSSNPNGSSGNNYVYLAFGQPIISEDKLLLAGR